MLSDWRFIAIFFLAAPIFPALPVVLNHFLLSPKKPNPIKQQTYECGIETVGDSWIQFKVQYYIYALVSSYLMSRQFFSSPLPPPTVN